MPTLLEVQHAVADFLLHGGEVAADLVVDDGIAVRDRLAIYRNTTIGNLVGALRIAYPAVRRLVGEDFFEGAARIFVETRPPRNAYLNVYGAEFPDFLAQFPPAASLVYLPDVARVEWAVNVALHAEDMPPLDASRLALPDNADIAFVPDPSVTLLRVEHSADAIWRAVIHEQDEALARIDLSQGSTFLTISRRNDAVSVDRITEREWEFSTDLFAGVPLSRALERADADMSDSLASHLAAGRFVGIRICDSKNPEEGRVS